MVVDTNSLQITSSPIQKNYVRDTKYEKSMLLATVPLHSYSLRFALLPPRVTPVRSLYAGLALNEGIISQSSYGFNRGA